MIDEADRLFGLPLEDFITERDALAKALRGEGRRGDADAVKALRKPPATVWAVNQVMRTQHGAARALIQAADRAAAAPGDREALRAHTTALEELTDAAAGLLSAKGRGLSQDALLRVRDALHAASLDRDLRDEFTAGRLTVEPPPAGFGAITATPPPRPRSQAKAEPKPKPKPKPEAKPEPKPKRPSAAARKRVDRAERRVQEAAAKLQDAERELAKARAKLDQG